MTPPCMHYAAVAETLRTKMDFQTSSMSEFLGQGRSPFQGPPEKGARLVSANPVVTPLRQIAHDRAG